MGRPNSAQRPNVLVHAEEVFRIVLRLELLEPPVVGPVGGGDRLALIDGHSLPLESDGVGSVTAWLFASGLVSATAEQQSALLMHRGRELLVRQRTMLANPARPLG
jgi:hypothetical protein